MSLPLAKANPTTLYTATMRTSQGTIVIKLLNSQAPCTVNSFVHLAEVNFWNKTQCHRVSDSEGLYMLQCGDPTAKASEVLSCTGTVGGGGPGYQFNDENLTGATYKAGTVAMANAGPNTNGSQFFLVFHEFRSRRRPTPRSAPSPRAWPSCVRSPRPGRHARSLPVAASRRTRSSSTP